MRNVFERSANRTNTYNVAYCNASGNLNNTNANNGNYAAPDCVARPDNERPSATSPATQRKEPSSRGESREHQGACGASGLRASGAQRMLTIEDAIGFDALMESAILCARGVLWKGTTSRFYMHLTEEVSRLCDELHEGTYRMRTPKRFEVRYPKVRSISAIAFRDRVVQRSYNDHVIYPLMSRCWIYDNYACQKGKGTDFARNRMRAHFERHLREHGETGAILIADAKGYYASMLHEIVDERFSAKLPAFAADFAREALGHQYPGDRGYSPGSQMVQIAGVDYLDPVDHFVKDGLAIRGYGRYMDDLIVLHESRQALEECSDAIVERMAALGIMAHPKKTMIVPFAEGITFLGFDYRIRRGEVRMYVNSAKVKDQRRRLRRLAGLVRQGRMSKEDYLQALACMLAHDAKGDSPALVGRMRTYGESLIG